MIDGRFVVELEGNHHYILVDTTTGYRYYCPAQEDANALARLLNNLQKLVKSQRKHINELSIKLAEFGVKDNNPIEYCCECKHSIVEVLNNDDNYYCELHERSVGKNDSCKQFTK